MTQKNYLKKVKTSQKNKEVERMMCLNSKLWNQLKNKKF